MIHYQEKILQFPGSVTRLSSSREIARFRVEEGTIEKFDFWRDNFNPGSEVTFQLYVNGVAQFDEVDRPVLAANTAHVGETGLAFDVEDGDVVSLEALFLGDTKFGLQVPAYFRIGITVAGGGGVSEIGRAHV